MAIKKDLVKLGSDTAKWWFKNEEDVVEKFNNWKNDEDSSNWLILMWYKLLDIEFVKAIKVKWSFKADIQVQITVKLKAEIDAQNIQVKLVSNKKGFNQIDKRWLKKYIELWDIPSDISDLLKYFVGEKTPYIKNWKDSRRIFMDEFTELDRSKILSFFANNKTLIISDLLKWRWHFSAEWILVIKKVEGNYDWVILPMNKVMNFYWNWPVTLSPRGSIKIWNITVQRKWWDNWRETANMLQFKMDPTLLFSI